MIINGKEEELQLTYPCNWNYKIFTANYDEVDSIVKCIVQERTFSMKYSHTSKKGTYKSYDVELLVHNEEDRLELFALFKNHTDIKMVL